MPSHTSTSTRRERLRAWLDPTVRPLWSTRRLFWLATAIGFILGLAVLNGLWTLRSTTNNCQRIAQLELVIQGQIRRSLKTLPTLAYYREHPAELRYQLRLAHDELRAFTPSACTLKF